MADTGELKEVKKVLIGPLLANNPITLQVLGCARRWRSPPSWKRRWS